MERKALNSLGYMELAAFFVFGTFLLGLYYDIVWLQWVTAILFILPMAGVLRYPSRCKERQEPFVKARFAWSLITMFLYLGMGFGLLAIDCTFFCSREYFRTRFLLRHGKFDFLLNFVLLFSTGNRASLFSFHKFLVYRVAL